MTTCHFEGYFASCLLHADDVILPSSSVIKLQKILSICYSYAAITGNYCLIIKISVVLCLVVIMHEYIVTDVMIGFDSMK